MIVSVCLQLLVQFGPHAATGQRQGLNLCNTMQLSIFCTLKQTRAKSHEHSLWRKIFRPEKITSKTNSGTQIVKIRDI